MQRTNEEEYESTERRIDRALSERIGLYLHLSRHAACRILYARQRNNPPAYFASGGEKTK